MTRTRRRTLVIGGVPLCLALALAVGAGGAVTLLSPGAGPGTSAGTPTAAPTPPAATAVVERGDLVQTARLDGAIGFGPPAPVTSKAVGTVTWLPDVGGRLDRGSVALRADERAVPVLLGEVPVYRALDVAGLAGADVSMVAANLMELGHLRRADPAKARTGGAFETAVRKWQKTLGLERTGRIGPADVIVLSAPSRVAAVSARVGDPAGGQPITVTPTTRLVEASVPARDAGAIGVGSTASIELPDRRVLSGSIVSVTTTGEGADAQVAAVITIDDQAALDGIDAAAVTVRITTRSVEDVLIVPVAALLALAEGGYAVQDESGGLHASEIGLIADDRVEIRGDGIEAGMTVVTAR
ncbi:peptidoglycan-binding protein [Clavibacter sp. Sh2088]|uniref:peptidoglycan-binding protein n=1 Tax=Clavibacter sp. Sh2088 TaxID=3397676 RepID=UPI0039E06968